MANSTITLQLEESTCSRLALYAAHKGLGSWAEAIEDMLAKCAGASTPAPTVASPLTVAPALGRALQKALAQPHLRSPEVIYWSGLQQEVRSVETEEGCLNEILYYHCAIVRLHYADGKEEDKFWRASNLAEDSSLRGNLNSGYLRHWREKGIVKAEVFPGNAEGKAELKEE